MFGNTAIAKCTFSGGRLVCSDVCAETTLDKVPNPKTSDTHVCSALYIDTVTGQAYNPALNSSNPENLNFNPNLTLQSSDYIQAAEVDDKGYAVIAKNVFKAIKGSQGGL